MPRLAAVLLLALALIAGCGGDDDDDGDRRARPSQSPPAATEGTFGRIPGIVEELRPSVVAIFATGARGQGEGSGVIWSSDGIIVTNAHVVEGADELEVQFADGERSPAEVRATDRQTDLAVLEVGRDGLPAADFADRLPAVGELAVAIGNPLGFEESVTAGIVSGIERAIPTGGRTPALVGLLQTDAAISPGNSGGALADADGHVIGVNVAYIPPQAQAVSIGFAIPSPTVIEVVEELLADGSAEHAFLGVGLTPLTAQIAERFGIDVDAGALVSSVSEGSPAAEAGLRTGDVIIEAGGSEIRTVEDLLAALRERDPGEEISLTVVRGDQRREVTTTLTARPSEPEP